MARKKLKNQQAIAKRKRERKKADKIVRGGKRRSAVITITGLGMLAV